MIARDIILFLLLNILPFIYLDWRHLHKKSTWGKRLLCWLPCVAMTAYTVYLAIQPNFIPDNDRIFILYGYLFLIYGYIVFALSVAEAVHLLSDVSRGKTEHHETTATFLDYC